MLYSGGRVREGGRAGSDTAMAEAREPVVAGRQESDNADADAAGA